MDKNSSIFSFNTLKGFPWPTRAFYVVLTGVLFYICMSPMLEVYALQSLNTSDLGYYIAQQRNPETRKDPFVLISGASYSGFGVSSLWLADKLCDWERDKNQAVVKMPLAGAYPWETYAFLKKYEPETDRIKIVVCDLHPDNIVLSPLLLDMSQLKYTIPSLGMIGMQDPRTGEPLSISFVLDRMQFFTQKGLVVVAKNFLYPKVRQDLLETNEHEALWSDLSYIKEKTLVMQAWNSRTPEEIEAYREQKISAQSDPILIQCVWDLVQYCQERGVFLVLHRTPFIADYNLYPHGYLDPTDPTSIVSECDRTFFQLQEQLKKTPGVLALDCPSFHSIGCDDEESTLFFDRVHMTRKGAEIYTNWLCDRMLESPQIRQILDDEQTKRTTHP